MLKLPATVAVTAIQFAAFASFAYAGNLQCNRDQSRCLVESNQITIGDKVGFFNDEGELVATGEVNAMRGERRAVLINQKHGVIRSSYDMSLMKAESEASPAYKVYREPAKKEIGASIGYSTVNMGNGSPALEFSGSMDWRQWRGLKWLGRAVYQNLSGTVAHDGEYGFEYLPINVTTIGALGGASYTIRENRPLALRGELAAGPAYIAGTVDGDSDLMDDASTNSKLKNGFALAGRWALGVVWNANDWHFHGSLAQTLVQQAFSNTLAFGLSKDLK